MRNAATTSGKAATVRGFAPIVYAALFLTCISAAACSKSEFNRQPISGQITYAGKPVESGFIVFEPDSEKGNRGPQGYASIVRGKYQTSETGKGTVGGPVKVKIVGLKPPREASEDSGLPLFEPYEIAIEIAANTTTLNFEVPLSSKARPR